MVKDSPIWISIPINFGGARLADLSDWTGLGANATATAFTGSTASSLLYTSAAAATLGAMGLWWMWTSRQPSEKITPLVDPKMQTRELKDGSRVCKYLKSDALMRCRYSDATTLYEVIRRGAKISKNGPMLGERPRPTEGGASTSPYQWITYNEVLEKSLAVGRGFRELGLPQGQDTFIGIYSKNKPDWIVVEHATYSFNNVLVPLYETLGADACIFIINQANIELVVCDSPEKAISLVEKKSDCPCLKHIVLACDVPSNDFTSLRDTAASVSLLIHTLDEVTSMGSGSSSLKPTPPRPDDLATICYTSGTTGTPKGVMLTHGNIVADCTTLEYFKHTQLNKNDVMISFLPLAHMFERVMHSVVYMEGGAVGFFGGDVRYLIDDIKSLRPTVMPVVPRVLNRLYDKVLAEVNKSTLTRLIFDAAIGYKSRELSNWIIRSTSLADTIVFKKVRESLGGRVRLIITGSAPLSESVLTFIRCAAGCPVIEGYGQTECVAASTVTIEGDFNAGHVGVPSPCNMVKLVDVAELGYFAKDKAGEVCIKGTNVFKGYYKMPEQTREALDSDGWLHTGDIGRWTEQGTLKIVDRKKHIFKLAQGEYVAPEKIENIYTRSKYVSQCFVHGESLKTCLVGVVVPDSEVLMGVAHSELGLQKEKRLEELCRHPKVKKLIMDDIIAVGKKAGLFSFEQVKDIHLCSDLFSVENDLLTPTLKTKRPQLKKHFQGVIEEMYSHLD